MSDLDVLNCAASGQVVFKFVCPMTWAQMTPTDSPRRRHCPGCDRAVHRCHDANEAGIRADQGECVAVPAWLAADVRASNEGIVIIGHAAGPSELIARAASRRVEGQ